MFDPTSPRAIILRNEVWRLHCAITGAKQPPSWMYPDKPGPEAIPALQAELDGCLSSLSALTGKAETVDSVRMAALEHSANYSRIADGTAPLDVWEEEARKGF